MFSRRGGKTSQTTNVGRPRPAAEENGKINAFEIKYNPLKNVKFPKSFMEAYEPTTAVVQSNNYHDFLM